MGEMTRMLLEACLVLQDVYSYAPLYMTRPEGLS
jgi:hypothetical protein